jgi:hypothetical protein
MAAPAQSMQGPTHAGRHSRHPVIETRQTGPGLRHDPDRPVFHALSSALWSATVVAHASAIVAAAAPANAALAPPIAAPVVAPWCGLQPPRKGVPVAIVVVTMPATPGAMTAAMPLPVVPAVLDLLDRCKAVPVQLRYSTCCGHGVQRRSSRWCTGCQRKRGTQRQARGQRQLFERSHRIDPPCRGWR